MSATKAAAEFGRRVRAIRQAKKVKSWKLAEQVDIEVKHLGRIERGEKRPSFELIIALGEALGISPAKFFEVELGAADSRTLQKEISVQLKGREAAQLRKARELLTVLFDAG